MVRRAGQPPTKGRFVMRLKSDEMLLMELVKKRGQALEELARRYERPLLGLACGMLGGREDLARDMVQESWIRVIRFASSFNGRCRVKTWLYQIVINQCRSLRGARAADSEESTGSLIDVAHASSQRGAVEEAIGNETKSSLRRAVASLAEEKREVILLCYHEGLTHEEVAEVLGIPLGTVKSRLNSALNALRKTLPLEVDS